MKTFLIALLIVALAGAAALAHGETPAPKFCIDGGKPIIRWLCPPHAPPAAPAHPQRKPVIR